MKHKYAVATAVVAFLILFPALCVPREVESQVTREMPDVRIEAVRSYFSKREMPLEEYAEKLVVEADRHKIDWRLLPAIAVQESSGGKKMCGNNPFGWGSCKIRFKSIEEGIETVARNLGGNNLRTRAYYKGDTLSKLWSYNGTVDPDYPSEVIRIMEKIGKK